MKFIVYIMVIVDWHLFIFNGFQINIFYQDEYDIMVKNITRNIWGFFLFICIL